MFASLLRKLKWNLTNLHWQRIVFILSCHRQCICEKGISSIVFEFIVNDNRWIYVCFLKISYQGRVQLLILLRFSLKRFKLEYSHVDLFLAPILETVKLCLVAIFHFLLILQFSCYIHCIWMKHLVVVIDRYPLWTISYYWKRNKNAVNFWDDYSCL